MENRVGDVVPSEAEIEELLKDIGGLRSKLEKYGDFLSPEARQSTLKPPEGSEATSRLITKLLTPDACLLTRPLLRPRPPHVDDPASSGLTLPANKHG